MNAFSLFFLKNPALLYGLSLIFGFFFPYSLIPTTMLLFFVSKKQKVLIILLFCLSFTFLKIYYVFPTKQIQGIAHFSVHEIKKAKNRGYIYRGAIKEFVSENKKSAAHIPASFFSYCPIKGADYQIEGILKPSHGKTYSLKTHNINKLNERKIDIPTLRYQIKKWVQNYLKKVMRHENAAKFLGGLATGQLQDRILSKEFEKRGLSHLLAVSGFHFALLAAFLHFCLRNFLPPKSQSFLLFIFLTLYFLFIGNAPSVQRAWVMATLFLVGQLIEKRGNSLNSLGFAIIVAFLFNPIDFYNGAFQLSFLATFGILMLYSPIKKGISLLFPKPKLLIDSLSICLAVHLALFPLLFLFFHKLPLHGTIYNLYFPILVTLSFLLMMLASFFHLVIAPGGLWLHFVNSHYTNLILKLLELPLIPHKTLYIENVSHLLLTIYLTLLFGGAIFLKQRDEKFSIL